MKKLILIITLLVSIAMFSSPSYSEWTKLSKNMMGNIFYVDFERLRKNSGYVYWWDMVDYLKITDQGILSHKQYRQGDCKLFRYKVLDYIFYKEPMGGGGKIHGLIAQEVKEALDKQDIDTFGGWDETPDGRQHISFEAFVLPLINSVKELSEIVKSQQKEIEELKKK